MAVLIDPPVIARNRQRFQRLELSTGKLILVRYPRADYHYPNRYSSLPDTFLRMLPLSRAKGNPELADAMLDAVERYEARLRENGVEA